jgi:hypothetical protein
MQRLFSALRYFPKLLAFFLVEKVTAKRSKQAQRKTQSLLSMAARYFVKLLALF